jgi:signal transduction histidine kinase
MSHVISKILDSVEAGSSPQKQYEFGRVLSDLFKQKYPEIKSYLLHFKYAVDCYRAAVEIEGIEVCIKRLKAASPKDFIEKGAFLQLKNLLIAALTDYKNRVKILIVFESPSNEDMGDISADVSEIRDLYRLATHYAESHAEAINLTTVNLVSRISHDINSLIALIPEENTKNEELYARINYSENLARDIMYYLREITADKSKVPLEDLLSGIISGVEFPSNVIFEVKYKNRSKYIDVDVELIDRAISAIIGNAIFATQIEGGRIQMSIDIIKNISPFIKHDWLEINVSDTGPGIPADFIHVIMNPLFTTWKDQGHVGLGIAITDKIIQAHQGDFKVKSEEGQGTTAIIHLPINESDEKK